MGAVDFDHRQGRADTSASTDGLTELHQELALAKDRLRLALAASKVCVWEFDVGTGAIVVSPELYPLLGYTLGELEATTQVWESLLHDDDALNLRAAIASHYRGETQAVDVVVRARSKDGNWRWLHTLGCATGRSESGRVHRMTGTLRDVSDVRTTDERLRLRELAIDAATNAIIIVDAQRPDMPVAHVNRAFEVMTGYSSEEAVGRNCRFLQGDDRDQPGIEQLRDAVKAGTSASVLLRNYRKDGTLFWNSLQVSPVHSESGDVTHFVGIQSDVTQLKNYQAALEFRANYDELTRLPNKNLFADRLEQAIRVAERAGRSAAVIHIGLDRFKTVNESLGHVSGDEVLREAARRMSECARTSDTVARVSGDEFSIALAGVDRDIALRVADAVREALEQPFLIDEHEAPISASIGVCLYPDEGASASAVAQRADVAMRRAKRAGGNQICFYTEDLNENALARLRLVSALRRGIKEGELELHYQPRVDLSTGRVMSLEALVRWRSPERGLVSPAEFIPVAEETGLIGPLGEWVLMEACAQMRRWKDAGRGELRVAVNLSARQFADPDLIEKVKAALAQSGLEARHLELEITESAAMHDAQRARATLERLSAIGISIAIDDFGTGYSSLAQLKRFPIDYLKIDQSFVRGLPESAEDAHIACAIIALGRSLKLRLIAEGVETQGQRLYLHAHGCHEMQGYLFSRPQPAAALEQLLQDGC